MIDPVALIEMIRHAPAEHLREMGALFLELAERREGNPDWDANMSLAIERVREQQSVGTLGLHPLPRGRVSVHVVRRARAKAPPPPAPASSSPDERKP